MRLELKHSWLKHNIGKTNLLYRKYKTYYNKISNINKLYYHHRKCNIPMHPDTLALIDAKVQLYIKQMDLLWCVIIYDEILDYKRHRAESYIPLGTWEKSIYISGFIENKKHIPQLRKAFQEKRNSNKPKMSFLDKVLKINEKLTSIFKM